MSEARGEKLAAGTDSSPGRRATSTVIIEWTGAVLGVGGNLLVALGWPVAGFVVWLFSNAAFIVFAVRTRSWGLGAMMGVYSVINLVGIAHWTGRL